MSKRKLIESECLISVKGFIKGKTYKSQVCKHGLFVLGDNAKMELCNPRNFKKIKVLKVDINPKCKKVKKFLKLSKVYKVECIQDEKQFKKGEEYIGEMCLWGELIMDEFGNWELCSARNFKTIGEHFE